MAHLQELKQRSNARSGAGAGLAPEPKEPDADRSARFFAQAQKKRQIYDKGLKKDQAKMGRIRQGFAEQGLDPGFMDQVYREHQAMLEAGRAQGQPEEKESEAKGKAAESKGELPQEMTAS